MTQHEIIYTTSTSNVYSMREKEYSSPHHRRCIDGSVTGCGKCVGYCSFCEHPGYLTKELRKQHDCIKKGCYYYSAKDDKKVEIISSPFTVLLSLV